MAKDDVTGVSATNVAARVAAAGTIDETALRLHIGSRHALTNWRDVDDPEDYHQHEHDGPCTIRNHPRASLDYDEDRAMAVEAEGFELDGGERL